MLVVCNKKALAGFKRRAARVFPKEYMELYFGHRNTGGIAIEMFVQIPQSATKYNIDINEEKLEQIIAETEAATGLEFTRAKAIYEDCAASSNDGTLPGSITIGINSYENLLGNTYRALFWNPIRAVCVSLHKCIE
jgi:hypothetical protein